MLFNACSCSAGFPIEKKNCRESFLFYFFLTCAQHWSLSEVLTNTCSIFFFFLKYFQKSCFSAIENGITIANISFSCRKTTIANKACIKLRKNAIIIAVYVRKHWIKHYVQVFSTNLNHTLTVVMAPVVPHIWSFTWHGQYNQWWKKSHFR